MNNASLSELMEALKGVTELFLARKRAYFRIIGTNMLHNVCNT